MKKLFSLLTLLSLGFLIVGCTPAPNPETEEKQQELNESPDYEKEMMGGGDAAK